MEKFKIYLIEASTGCTCCASENHMRGPFRTEEDAKRRIEYYHNSPRETGYWPLASQYARRGRYSVEEYEVEPISDDRFILGEEKVLDSLNFIDVNEDGTIKQDSDAEWFGSDNLFGW